MWGAPPKKSMEPSSPPPTTYIYARIRQAERGAAKMAQLLLGVALATPVSGPGSGGGASLVPQSLRRQEAHRVQVRCNPGAYTGINNERKGGENMTRWCEANCLVGFCPGDMCKCTDGSAPLLPVDTNASESGVAPRTWRRGAWVDSQADTATEAGAPSRATTTQDTDKGGVPELNCVSLSQTVTDHWCRTSCTTRWGGLGACPKNFCRCTEGTAASDSDTQPTQQQQQEGRKAATAHKEAEQAAADATRDAEDFFNQAKREAQQQREDRGEAGDSWGEQGYMDGEAQAGVGDDHGAEQADDQGHKLLHAGMSCYDDCGKHGGYCSFCGDRPAACCHGSGSYPSDGPECVNVTHSMRTANGTLRHACVFGRQQDELAVPEIPQFDSGDKFKKLDKTALEVCQRRWKNAMKQMEEKTEDPSDIYRGDNCLKAETKPVLLFVHVGKTCGSSVMQALRNPQNQRAIQRLAPGHEPFDAVHMHPVRREVADSMKRVLITLRDPVDRFISSYNTAACIGDPQNDPSQCRRKENGDEALSASHIKPGTPLTNKITSECFNNVTSFADNLDADTECGRLARDAIGPNYIEDLGHVGHIGKGACYYLGGVLERLKDKDVYVIDTETCDAGIRGIPTWLGLNSTEFVMPPKVHVGHYPHHDDTVTDEGRTRLRKYLSHEYALHEKLRRWTWNRQLAGLTRLGLEGGGPITRSVLPVDGGADGPNR